MRYRLSVSVVEPLSPGHAVELALAGSLQVRDPLEQEAFEPLGIVSSVAQVLVA